MADERRKDGGFYTFEIIVGKVLDDKSPSHERQNVMSSCRTRNIPAQEEKLRPITACLTSVYGNRLPFTLQSSKVPSTRIASRKFEESLRLDVVHERPKPDLIESQHRSSLVRFRELEKPTTAPCKGYTGMAPDQNPAAIVLHCRDRRHLPREPEGVSCASQMVWCGGVELH